jgi:DNA polymerase-3 subunit beta
MKVMVLKRDLIGALSALKPVINPRKNASGMLLFLWCVRLEAINGELFVSGTNLEQAIRVKVPATIQRDGVTIVPLKLLSTALGQVPTGELVLDQEGMNLFIRGWRNKEPVEAFVLGIHPDNWPVRDYFSDHAPVPLNGADLTEAARQVVFSAAGEDNRPILTAVNVVFQNTRLTLAAADGNRLSIATLSTTVEQNSVTNVPAKAFEILANWSDSIITFDPPAPGEYVYGATGVVFKGRNIALFSISLEGVYPSLNAIVPKVFTSTFEVNAVELLNACELLEANARDNENVVILTFKPAGDRPVHGLTLHSRKTSEREALLAKATPLSDGGKPIKIAFDIGYLIDYLRAAGDNVIRVELSKPDRPALFTLKTNSRWQHVIMPMSVYSYD